MSNRINDCFKQIPDELFTSFADVCEMNGKSADKELQNCMMKYMQKNVVVEFDPTSMTGEELSMFQRVCEFEDLFDDMHFASDSLVDKFINVKYGSDNGDFVSGAIPIPDKIRYFDPQSFDYHIVPKESASFWGCYNQMERSLTLREDAFGNDAVLLHEMIHMHEHAFEKVSRFYRDILFFCLYNDLKPKLEQDDIDLDKLILNHSHVAEGQRITVLGGQHDILFYLKSLDLDIKMGYELGTVCGYGRNLK